MKVRLARIDVCSPAITSAIIGHNMCHTGHNLKCIIGPCRWDTPSSPSSPSFSCFSRAGITTRLKKAIKKAEIPLHPRERSEMGHFGRVLIWGAGVRVRSDCSKVTQWRESKRCQRYFQPVICKAFFIRCDSIS